MTEDRKGSDLFIVDNSISGWTGSRYLREWVDFADRFDIATGWFDIGSLLELDGAWQRLDKIRILMGADSGASTKALIARAVRERAERMLDASLDIEKSNNPFLQGTEAIVDALKSGQIECRVYVKDKFHAKTYITHARSEVIGARALVGSSNFTRPGLTENVELNIQVQSAQEVAELQEWYEHHWNLAEDVTPEVLRVLDRHTRLHTPFDVYSRALHEFFKGHEITATEWEERASKMFPRLDRYQKEAYWALMKIASQYKGAFLCDGVGLGKTFVGLMLIERLVVHERKRVVLFAPKGAKEGVWEPHLRQYLAHIGGVGSGADFSNLTVFAHSDLNRGGEFPERFRRVAELADAVVIDEAHHFRNPGRKANEEAGVEASRYWKLFDLLDQERHPKSVFMLTATPINNRLADLRHMIELFSRGDDAYFARTLGVNNLTAHFNGMERALRKIVGLDKVDLTDSLAEANDLLSKDETFQSLVVQRSRAYAVESQKLEKGAAAIFPRRSDPKVAEYSVRKTYGKLLDMIDDAFKQDAPLFKLSVYYPLAYYRGSEEVDPFDENRQKQVVGLIRTQFLKRFESSVRAFEVSCFRLLTKLQAFLEVNCQTEGEKKRFERWKRQNGEILFYATSRQTSLLEDIDEEVEDEDFGVPEELLKKVPHLSRDDYDVDEILDETYLDMDQIVHFLREAQKFDPKQDDKLNKLKRLLKSKDLAGDKVLVFTEFADTARYLAKELQADGIGGVFEVDSGSKSNRADVIKRFAPYYNGSSSQELKAKGQDEIRILISTDILSEGLNLQDACRLINFDIHWNPVRLMQRVGRVDRRLNPEVEKALVADHPEAKASRGRVSFWNFLPPGELNEILSLYAIVTGKTLLISKTQGIEGKKLLTEKDDYEALKEFNHAYEGTRSALEDMHLDYQSLLQEFPQLEDQLDQMPGSIFSGRRRSAKGGIRGVFFCFRLPALNTEVQEFTEEAGTTRWYLYDLARGEVLEEPGEIVKSIEARPSTPRVCVMGEEALTDIRDQVLKHIKNGYLKRLNAPIGVKPTLKCWMEINDQP